MHLYLQNPKENRKFCWTRWSSHVWWQTWGNGTLRLFGTQCVRHEKSLRSSLLRPFFYTQKVPEPQEEEQETENECISCGSGFLPLLGAVAQGLYHHIPQLRKNQDDVCLHHIYFLQCLSAGFFAWQFGCAWLSVDFQVPSCCCRFWR